MSEEKYITPSEAAKLLKVSTRTLQLWEQAGKLRCIRTKGNHRRFLTTDIDSLAPNPMFKSRRKICYCRVSSVSQKDDLKKQVEYFRCKYPNHEIIQDIGSSLDLKREGLNSILESALQRDIEEVVITHKDRLCRFSFEFLQRVIEGHSSGKIVIINKKSSSPQEELVNELISIITVFSSKLYGLRNHGLKKELTRWVNENSQHEDPPSEEDSL